MSGALAAVFICALDGLVTYKAPGLAYLGGALFAQPALQRVLSERAGGAGGFHVWYVFHWLKFRLRRRMNKNHLALG